MIYFVQAGRGGPIKIGYSKQDVSARVRYLQSANAQKLRILRTTPGGPRFEAALHCHLRMHRIRGEWFRPSRLLMSRINAFIANPPLLVVPTVVTPPSTARARLRLAVNTTGLQNAARTIGCTKKLLVRVLSGKLPSIYLAQQIETGFGIKIRDWAVRRHSRRP